MDKIGDKIRAARKQAGLTQIQLAEKLGIRNTTLASWEQHKHIPKKAYLIMLEKILGSNDNDDIAFGEYASRSIKQNYNSKIIVPIVGYVGAGGGISPIDDHAMGGGIDEVEAPPNSPPNTVAVIVKGDSMIPMFYEGMHVFYSQRLKNVEDYINSIPLIVHLEDDRKAIKTIIKGSKWGLYTLTSFNADPIADIRIESVSPIDWIKPILPLNK